MLRNIFWHDSDRSGRMGVSDTFEVTWSVFNVNCSYFVLFPRLFTEGL